MNTGNAHVMRNKSRGVIKYLRGVDISGESEDDEKLKKWSGGISRPAATWYRRGTNDHASSRGNLWSGESLSCKKGEEKGWSSGCSVG